MKWRNVDEILPDYGTICVVKGLNCVVKYDHCGRCWRAIYTYFTLSLVDSYKEWLYYDEVLELIEESEE